MKKITDKQEELLKRIEHGDYQRIVEALGISRNHLYNIRKGRRQADYVWDFIERYLNERSEKRKAKNKKNR